MRTHLNWGEVEDSTIKWILATGFSLLFVWSFILLAALPCHGRNCSVAFWNVPLWYPWAGQPNLGKSCQKAAYFIVGMNECTCPVCASNVKSGWSVRAPTNMPFIYCSSFTQCTYSTVQPMDIISFPTYISGESELFGTRKRKKMY